jgi:hypothetical protein
MPQEGRKQDEVEKILSDEKPLVDRKKAAPPSPDPAARLGARPKA